MEGRKKLEATGKGVRNLDSSQNREREKIWKVRFPEAGGRPEKLREKNQGEQLGRCEGHMGLSWCPEVTEESRSGRNWFI